MQHIYRKKEYLRYKVMNYIELPLVLGRISESESEKSELKFQIRIREIQRRKKHGLGLGTRPNSPIILCGKWRQRREAARGRSEQFFKPHGKS